MSEVRMRVGIAHPCLQYGGSEAVAAWALEALKKEYRVSVITMGGVDLEGLNRFYGTCLKPSEVSFCRVPMPFFLKMSWGGDALRGAIYHRYCRRVATKFDMLISVYNLCDFGVPAVHFIADFSWDKEIAGRLDCYSRGFRGLFHKNRWVGKSYTALVRAVASPSDRDLFSGADRILANSYWSARIIRAKYGADVDVLYPPVHIEFADAFPENSEDGFVYLGRIAPEKHIERIVEILKEVRRRGHNIHFHLVGGAEGSAYGKLVERMCRAESHWISMEGRLSGQQKSRLLCQHRFGINACPSEAFGIAAAEMVKSGCITFVPSHGGQVEIVNHPLLTYDNVQDAVEKIEHVLESNETQVELQKHLAEQSKRFSAEKYVLGIKDIVSRFLKENGQIQT